MFMKHVLLIVVPVILLGCQSQPAMEQCCGAESVSKPLPVEIKYQNPDGSWGKEKNKRVYTSLMLIKLLHEGKTPSSEMYGQTVSKAMKYLTAIEARNILQNKENGLDAYLVLDALKLSNKTVKAETLTNTRQDLEKLLMVQTSKDADRCLKS